MPDDKDKQQTDKEAEKDLRADRDDALGYSREVITNEESQDIQIEDTEQDED
jgi:hypothetical protein